MLENASPESRISSALCEFFHSRPSFFRAVSCACNADKANLIAGSYFHPIFYNNEHLVLLTDVFSSFTNLAKPNREMGLRLIRIRQILTNVQCT